jgi:chaperone modulatory protein CbpM
MHNTHSEDFWLHEQYEFSLSELAHMANLSEAELREWVDEGLLRPLNPVAADWHFGADCLLVALRARRLRGAFELAPRDLALVEQLLERICALENEVRELRAKLPRVMR